MLDRQSYFKRLVVAVIMIAATIGAGCIYLAMRIAFLSSIIYVGYFLIAVSLLLVVLVLVWFFVHHGFVGKGWKYGVTHLRIEKSLSQQMLDKGIYVKKYNMPYDVVLPQYKLRLDDDLGGGLLTIRRNMSIAKRLEDTDFSPALLNYKVDVPFYITDDGNDFCIDIVEASRDFRYTFSSIEDMLDTFGMVEDYCFKIDRRHGRSIPLTHSLYSGSTGSGKTISISSLILQALFCWDHPAQVIMLDPKGSDIYVWGRLIGSVVARDNAEILAAISNAVKTLEKRQRKLDKILEKYGSGSTFKDFGWSPIILIFDEYSACLDSLSKQERNQLEADLARIIKVGRQAGIVLWQLSQTASATEIPSSIKNNAVFKVVFGNAPATTYQMSFGESADRPKTRFGVGRGVFTFQGLTMGMTEIAFPYMDFDVSDAFREFSRRSAERAKSAQNRALSNEHG